MIRKVNKNDAVSIAKIYNYYIKNTAVSFEEQPVTAVDIQNRMKEVSDSNLPWLVAEENGSIVGYAYSTKWKGRSAYRFSVEVAIYLSHTQTNRGLGSKLFSELFDILKTLKVHTIIGGIALPNPASIALHERFDMKKVAHFKDVGYKFGKWIDVAYWQVVLNT